MMLKWLDRLIDRLFAVAGAILLSQGPAFIQQYVQQIQGALLELHRQIVQLTVLANGKTMDQFVSKFLTSQDADFVGQGHFIQSILQRQEELKAALNGINEASFFTRPFHFLYHLHYDLLNSTWKHFTPSLSITAEGVLYILVGLFLGYAVWAGIKGLSRGVASLYHRNK